MEFLESIQENGKSNYIKDTIPGKFSIELKGLEPQYSKVLFYKYCNSWVTRVF